MSLSFHYFRCDAERSDSQMQTWMRTCLRRYAQYYNDDDEYASKPTSHDTMEPLRFPSWIAGVLQCEHVQKQN